MKTKLNFPILRNHMNALPLAIAFGIMGMLLFVTCSKTGDIPEQGNSGLLKSVQTDLLVNIPPERAYICSGNIVEILDLPTLSFIGQINISQGGAQSIEIIKSKRIACITHNLGVSKIDLKTNEVTATLDFPNCPQTCDIAITPDGKTAFVTLYYSNAVAVIDVDKWTLLKIIPLNDLVGPNGIEMGQGGQFVFVANQASGTLAVIDVKKQTLYKELSTNTTGINELALTPGNQYIFCTAFNENQLVVIDSKKISVTKYIDLQQTATGIDITKNGKTAYASSGGNAGLSQIDVKTFSVTNYTNQISGQRIRINSNDKLAILTLHGRRMINVVNLSDISVYRSLDSNGDAPWGIDFLAGTN